MKRVFFSVLLVFSASAQAGSFADAVIAPLLVKPPSGGIPHIGDETDLSWQYVVPAVPKRKKSLVPAPSILVEAPGTAAG
jgi:hypothetical protein